ncbi:uncharacterized protein LOC133531869 [Cydia pomonella]|uniref:uncharacterized protein LOC133531869 n=1 Tax=Cydia pomonella TaxID=82600 RepID=UPI002ADE5241|nr:uncharacterized protein LOC133531869 [Cydia pomonella]
MAVVFCAVEKPWTSAPLSTRRGRPDDAVAAPTTEFAKQPKKRHHKKHFPKRSKERLQHSLLLDDSGDFVAVGGLNHTDAMLRAAAAGRAGGEPERDQDTHRQTLRPWLPSEQEFYVHTARPDSVEIHLTADTARDKDARGDRDRTPEDTKISIDDTHRDKLDRDSAHKDDNNKARSEAIARHASVYEFKKVADERGRKERRGGKTRAQMLSEIQGKPLEENRSWSPARHSADVEKDSWAPWDPWGPREAGAAPDVVLDTR